MAINAYSKAELLLQAIANSLYDRDPNNEKPIYFSISEIHLVERFLKELIQEYDTKK
jgi:hypothetical protein